ncbi:hypothetical protein K461DRAFT_282672 [Myriangium duriaei CBS 260.36]|uniref:CFEM domain-containing protein n=1 Tax=Myriangium duriaei CBS 260.36 TaxID=1168546 RepID=A0A9P4IRA3_9PEZI|nr:hypothetical protein K461DRAFT_282672 [Myriangium duriaei CBS 260.36]
MRSFVYTAVAIASALAVQAAAPPGLPDCTANCIDSTYGGCGSFNIKCICGSSTWIAGLACCISKVCSPADQETTIKFADNLCAANGVTTLQSTATCAPGQTPSFVAGATNTGSASGGSSSASTTGSSAASASGSSSSGTATSSMSSGATAGSQTAASSSASASHTGSANKVEAAAFGVGAVVFGALAAL